MNAEDMARRTQAQVVFDGTDITDDIKPYLLSLVYSDNEDDEADDLQLTLQDRDGLWTQSWLNEAIEAASAAKLKIEASIIRKNWVGDGKNDVLPCGKFELDSVDSSGPPDVVSIKATSLAFSAAIRQTKKTKAWESYNLSGIAGEMAGNAGLSLMYKSSNDPFYKRVEQVKTSDIDFLSQLCKKAGISLKATDEQLVLFDQVDYEAQAPIDTITRGCGYTKRKLHSGAASTQYASCRVSYTNSETGVVIEATAKTDDYNSEAKNNQQLEVSARVDSVAEAQALAEKKLRQHNKYAKTASFTFPGKPEYVVGVTLSLKGWGAWDGKYIISQARHAINNSGYTTQISLRKILEGY